MAVLSSVLVLIGVSLSLYGTRRFRESLRRLVTSIARHNPEPVSGGGSGTIASVASLGAGVAVKYPADATEDEKRLLRMEAHIDALEKRMANHPHPQIDKRLRKLADMNERIRADLDAKIHEITSQAETADRFNMAGLLFVAAGTVVAVLGALSLPS